MGALLAEIAEAQESNALVSVQDIESLERWSVTQTGELRLVFENGTEQIIPASEFTIVDGVYYILDGPAIEVLAALEGRGGIEDYLPAILGIGGVASVSAMSQSGSDQALATHTGDGLLAFTSAATASVPENQTAAITVAASNADSDPVSESQAATLTAAGSDADGDPVTYAITGGEDAAQFSIDADTGVVTFNTAPDFEMPSDAGDNNVYDLVVSATAGGQTVEQAVTITVTDVDDTPPVFTSGPAVSVSENQTDALTVAANAPNGDPVTYAIAGGLDSALFSIDADTGVVTFNTAPDFEMPSDAGDNNVYDLVVSATAGGQTVEQAVTITVTDVDDTPPVFTSGPAVSVSENQTDALTVAANAPNGDPVTYAITGGVDSALFSIDADTGVVTFNTAPDFEMPSDAGGNNVYDLVVSATAGGQTVEQIVTITVTDVDDTPPVFTSGPAVSVSENQTDALTVAANAPNGDPVTYAIAGGADAAQFSIDADTGVVTFNTAPDFEMPSDMGGNNVYDLVVSATAGGQTVEQAVTITVTDVDDTPPVFTSGPAVSVSEHQTDALTVAANAPNGDPVTYAIAGGADAAQFSIDADTGVVTFNTAPDFEMPSDAGDNNVYDLVVSATAGGQTVEQAVTITVTNIEEAASVTDLSDLPSAQGFVIQGAAPGDNAGWSVSSAGDVNGDGIDDLIVGAPLANTGGSYSGEAYVIYGGIALDTIDLENLLPSDGFRIQGAEPNDYAGVSVSSAGDVNGDGFADLIVGAPYGDYGGNYAGETYVIFGGAEVSTIDLNNLAADDGIIIQGDATYDRSGRSVSHAGDVNGDGYDDLIVGAPFGGDGGTYVGEAYVLYGGSGLTDTDLNGLSTLNYSRGFIIRGDEQADQAGWSVSSAGDVNGDGFDDLIVGAPFGDDGGTNAGEAYVLYGGSGLIDIDLNDLSALNNTQGIIIQGDAAGDRAGRSVSYAGDVNGDGFDDLIVGAPFGDDGDTDAGEAYVIYGGAGLGLIDLNSLNAAQGFIILGDYRDDWAGYSVSSAGDVNGDGFADLIVGAPVGDDGGTNAGEAYVVYGGTDLENIDLSELKDTQGFIIQGNERFDNAGWSVSTAGDVNGDGYDDLIVGAPFGDAGGTNAGEAYVIYGGGTGTESTIALNLTGTAAADNFTGNAGADTFTNITTGDVVRGGAGDDVIRVTSLDFADIDGGHGTDSLVFDGAGLSLDMSTHTQRIDRIETINLTGSGDNQLTLDKLSVLDLSEATENGVTTLTVRGDAGDSVYLSDTGWAGSLDQDIGGITYSVYVNFEIGGHGARLLVEDGVSVTTLTPPTPGGKTQGKLSGDPDETVDLTDPEVFDLATVSDGPATLSELGGSAPASGSFFDPANAWSAGTSLPIDLDGAANTIWSDDEMNLSVDLLHLIDAAAMVDMGG